jgi:hypothetical protein
MSDVHSPIDLLGPVLYQQASWTGASTWTPASVARQHASLSISAPLAWTLWFRSDVGLAPSPIWIGQPNSGLFSADPVLGEVDLRWPGVSLSRCELAKGMVRPGCVVVAQVLSQHPAQMIFIDDQQPVEDLPAQGADHPFADRVTYSNWPATRRVGRIVGSRA